jgi:hypothetical protein
VVVLFQILASHNPLESGQGNRAYSIQSVSIDDFGSNGKPEAQTEILV